jgi:N-glycosylase/DNA lyase
VQNKLIEKKFLLNKFDATPLLLDKNHYIRFHNQKAKRLLNAINYYPTLKKILNSNNDKFAIRQQIKNDFVGIGMKEASHFLRNIGYKNLAIIDRHILRNLTYCGVLTDATPPKNEKQYLEIEKKMLNFANEIEIDMDVLDLLFFAHSTGKVLK